MKKGMFLLSTAVIGLIIGLSSCGNETSNEKKEVKEIEKEVPLKIGDKYEGGYIFFLDFDGKHGKICAPSSESDNLEIKYQELLEVTKKIDLNGFKDWRLPTADELNFIRKNGDQKIFAFNEKYYWSSDSHENANGKFNVIVDMDKINGGIESDYVPSNIEYYTHAYSYRLVREF